MKTIYSIQALRAVAALLVVYYHCVGYFRSQVNFESPWIDQFGRAMPYFGSFGVDLFFVISGFVMVYISRGKHKVGAGLDFIKQRLLRIMPMYWLFTIVTSILLYGREALRLVYPRYFGDIDNTFDVGYFFQSILLLPVLNKDGILSPILGQGWTLNFEIYFYLLILLTLHFSRSWQLPILLSISLITVTAGFFLPAPSTGVGVLLTSPQIFEFIAGAVLGHIFLAAGKIPWRTGLLVLLVGLGMTFCCFNLAGEPSQTIFVDRAVWWGLPASLIVAGCVLMERARTTHFPAFVLSLGDSSYALYLSHVTVIMLVGKSILILGLHRFLSTDLLALLLVLVCLSVGHFLYVFLELPVTRGLKKISTSTHRLSTC